MFSKYFSGDLFLCLSNSKLCILGSVSKFINTCMYISVFKVIILQFLAVKSSGTVSIS